MYYQREFHIHVNIFQSRVSVSLSGKLQNTIKINLALLHRHAGNILFIDMDASRLAGLSVGIPAVHSEIHVGQANPSFSLPKTLLGMLRPESNLFAFLMG